MNVLVTYESRRGHTRQAAEAIATVARDLYAVAGAVPCDTQSRSDCFIVCEAGREVRMVGAEQQ